MGGESLVNICKGEIGLHPTEKKGTQALPTPAFKPLCSGPSPVTLASSPLSPVPAHPLCSLLEALPLQSLTATPPQVRARQKQSQEGAHLMETVLEGKRQ